MTTLDLMSGLSFVKGHGTRNDFVLLPDRDDRVTLGPDLVRALCDRRAGVGGDGVIRVAASATGTWFMDYWNADGTTAEMCGNGARLFARFLVDEGWQEPGTFDFVTRGGPRTATVGPTGDVGIGMGPVRVGPGSVARAGGREWAGLAVDVGNPHLACLLGPDDDLAALDLSTAPRFDPALFPHGTNVEFVRVDGPDRISMRVFERGVGETQSCGTGTVAAAAALLADVGRTGGRVQVDVPGGTVWVDLAERAGTGHPAATLTGPAVLVARGTVGADL